MGTRGFLVYRLHGIYYRVFLSCGASPSDEGKKIANEIPADPEAFGGK